MRSRGHTSQHVKLILSKSISHACSVHCDQIILTMPTWRIEWMIKLYIEINMLGVMGGCSSYTHVRDIVERALWVYGAVGCVVCSTLYACNPFWLSGWKWMIRSLLSKEFICRHGHTCVCGAINIMLEYRVIFFSKGLVFIYFCILVVFWICEISNSCCISILHFVASRLLYYYFMGLCFACDGRLLALQFFPRRLITLEKLGAFCANYHERSFQCTYYRVSLIIDLFATL